MSFLRRYGTLPLDAMEKLTLSFSALLFAVMTIFAFVAVILRYFFDTGVMWETEVLGYFMAWGVFLGAASVTRENSHVRVSYFADKIFGEKRAPKVSFTLENIIGICACGYLTHIASRWIIRTVESGAIGPGDLQYALWIPRLVVVIGLPLMVLYYTERLVKQIISWRTPDTAENEQSEESVDI